MLALFLVLFVLLVVLFVVVPFVLGFFAKGAEWVLVPTKYLDMYLTFMAGLGTKVKTFFATHL